MKQLTENIFNLRNQLKLLIVIVSVLESNYVLVGGYLRKLDIHVQDMKLAIHVWCVGTKLTSFTITILAYVIKRFLT